MTVLDELTARARAQRDRSNAAETPAVMVSARVPSDSVVDALVRCFGENEHRAMVRFIVDEEEIGYLTRSDLYSFVGPRQRSVGQSGQAGLPGEPRFRVLALRCPISGCGSRRVVMHVDETDPLGCPRHPATLMELGR